MRTDSFLFACGGILAGLSLYFIGSSLFASHWVYDRSDLYKWTWLSELLKSSPVQIVNLHAGFDESSDALRQMFPKATLSIFDFYEASSETEDSIARARKKSAATLEARQIDKNLGEIGVNEVSIDLVLLFLAVHEIRSPVMRDNLFRKVHDMLRPNGLAILVEHLRDLPNFLAFGPGVLHFFSLQEWMRSTKSGDLVIQKRLTITPFIHVFCLTRSS